MPQREYICPVLWDEDTKTFSSSISPVLAANNVNWAALDLRGVDEQAAKTGHMLVLCPDVPGPVHDAIMGLGGVHVYNDNMTKSAIDAIIGNEGTNERHDAGKGREYLERVQRQRRARFRRERHL